MSKLKKKLKTQGKNSKLKTKTQFFGIFRILRCEKGVQKKPDLDDFKPEQCSIPLCETTRYFSW